MEQVVNELTGAVELQFEARLERVANKPRANKPNGTLFRTCLVTFINAQKREVTRTATIWESNFDYGVEPGQTYLCRAQQGDDGRIYLKMSHLEPGSFAEDGDFDFTGGEPTVAQDAPGIAAGKTDSPV